MLIKGIIDTDFVNYKEPVMTIMFPFCSMKCGKELCQNSPVLSYPDIKVTTDFVIQHYLNNNITKGICFQGMEPLDSWDDVKDLVFAVRERYGLDDLIIIFTGYTKEEISDKIEYLKMYPNIIVKFGRYIPNQEPHYDEVLGINLISDNQYAKEIS